MNQYNVERVRARPQPVNALSESGGQSGGALSRLGSINLGPLHTYSYLYAEWKRRCPTCEWEEVDFPNHNNV
jgi:hypothetical protein